MKRIPRGRVMFRNPFRSVLAGVIRSPEVEAERIAGAFRSLPEEDRDCLPWVPRMLALEG